MHVGIVSAGETGTRDPGRPWVGVTRTTVVKGEERVSPAAGHAAPETLRSEPVPVPEVASGVFVLAEHTSPTWPHTAWWLRSHLRVSMPDKEAFLLFSLFLFFACFCFWKYVATVAEGSRCPERAPAFPWH